jgi:hypothetical protein
MTLSITFSGVIMLKVVMLSVAFFIVMLSVVMQSVVALAKNDRVDLNYVFASYPWALLQKIGKPE